MMPEKTKQEKREDLFKRIIALAIKEGWKYEHLAKTEEWLFFAYCRAPRRGYEILFDSDFGRAIIGKRYYEIMSHMVGEEYPLLYLAKYLQLDTR